MTGRRAAARRRVGRPVPTRLKGGAHRCSSADEQSPSSRRTHTAPVRVTRSGESGCWESRHLVGIRFFLLDLREVRRVVCARDEGRAVSQHHLRDGTVVEPMIRMREPRAGDQVSNTPPQSASVSPSCLPPSSGTVQSIADRERIRQGTVMVRSWMLRNLIESDNMAGRPQNRQVGRIVDATRCGFHRPGAAAWTRSSMPLDHWGSRWVYWTNCGESLLTRSGTTWTSMPCCDKRGWTTLG